MPLLFIGLLANFNNDIKAEEICKYNNSKSYEECLNNSPTYQKDINYPIIIGNTYKYFLWDVNDNECGGSFTQFCRIHLYSENSNNIVIKKGPSLGFNSIVPFKPKTNLKIPTYKIIGWDKLIGKVDMWQLQYFDENWSYQRFTFRRIAHRKTDGNLISEYFQNSTNLKGGLKKEVNLRFYAEGFFNKLNKEIDIIGSIIIASKNNKDCFSLSEKFPKLNKRYKNLLFLKRKLEIKLDLPPSNDLKPICDT